MTSERERASARWLDEVCSRPEYVGVVAAEVGDGERFAAGEYPDDVCCGGCCAAS